MDNELTINYPFVTPIWNCKFPDFTEHKQTFIDAVRKFKNENEGIQKSNIGGGYQSPFNLMQEQALSPLYEYILDQSTIICQQLNMFDVNIGISGSWVNFNDTRSASNILHNHEGILSGIFYLNVPEGSGALILQNPGLNTLWEGLKFVESRNNITGELTNIVPVEGEIIIWPSYLMHGVHPNSHDGERISIAFNVSGVPLYG